MITITVSDELGASSFTKFKLETMPFANFLPKANFLTVKRSFLDTLGTINPFKFEIKDISQELEVRLEQLNGSEWGSLIFPGNQPTFVSTEINEIYSYLNNILFEMSGRKVGEKVVNFRLSVTNNPSVGQGRATRIYKYQSFKVIGVNEKPTINNFELKAIEIPDQLSFGQLAFTKYTNQIIRNRKELLSRGFINEDGDKIYPFKGLSLIHI